MKPKNPAANMPKDWTDTGPSAVEIVESELITGKLHPAWHGDEQVRDQAEKQPEDRPYTDSVLRDIERKDRRSFPDRGDDER